MAPAPTASVLPRSLLVVGGPVIGVLLVSILVIRGFPYDVAADRITTEVERAFGVRVALAELGPALRLTGPGLEATGVRVLLENSETLRLDEVFARPAWSLSWFRGAPAIRLEARGPAGGANGTVTLGSSPGWDGVLDAIDLAALPTSTWVPGGAMKGVLSGGIDVQLEADGPIGSASLVARDGTISLPSLPVDIPFEELTGEFRLGGDALLEIASFSGSGPIVSGSGSGKVARAATVQQSPLSLEFDLEVKPALAGAARSAGLRVDRQGRTRVRVTGTVAQPRIR